jgi:hypothetical protein
MPTMSRRFAEAGRGSESWCVMGAGHFYPATSRARRGDGTQATVAEAIEAFLDRVTAA